MCTFVRYAGLAGAVTVAAVAVGPPAAGAAAPGPAHAVAYVRAGSVYVLSGSVETRLTRHSDDTRPRWSPDGRRIAYVHRGRLWVMNADGTGSRALASGVVGGATWSPDGRWLAYPAPSCTGIDGVFQVATTGAPGTPQALFPASCRGVTPPRVTGRPQVGGGLAARMRADSAVAWSPDGTWLAFRGGQCLAVYDDCLTVGEIATGTEQLIDAYGGGGQIFSGFAVVPAWAPDGQRLSWTAAQDGADAETIEPVHAVEADPTGAGRRTVGAPLDRELAYDGTGRGVLTGQYRGASWLFTVDLATGARTPLRQGSQPSVR